MKVLPYLAVVLGPRRIRSLTTTERDDCKIRGTNASRVPPHLATIGPTGVRSISLLVYATDLPRLRSNKCYQHAAFAPPLNEPAEKRCQPRGGNCPEAMQPPHSSADRATSIHEPRFQLGASFNANANPIHPGSAKEFRAKTAKSLRSHGICEIFEGERGSIKNKSWCPRVEQVGPGLVRV